MKSKKTTLKLIIALFTLVGAFSANAQAVKFGKIDEPELRMSTYDKDTSAAAVILSDQGSSRFIYAGGFKIAFERHTRIKILKKAGYEWADVSIPFYEKNSDREKVSSIKGYTYNLVDGKIVKDKLDTKQMFEEQFNENWFAKKFTMPNVKEGSVIEYSYTVTSDFLYNLRDWKFQTTIPVAWSEYSVTIPEYFNYKFWQQGYLPFYDSKQEKKTGQFSDSNNAANVQTRDNAYVWMMKDVPALREEKYISTLSDYQSRIEFELQSYQFPGQMLQVTTGDWEQVTRDLLNEEMFGGQLKRNNFFKDEIAAITLKHKDPKAQAQAIYNLVKNTMKWNGKNRIYTESSIRKAYDSRTGSAPEINLLLTSMMLEAGLDAAPVLLSTRDHGRVVEGSSPMLTKFNYVVSNVKIADNEYLLDATEPLLPMGVLPVRCLNGSGRVIKKDDQRWVDLTPRSSDVKFFSAELTINGQGEIKGKGLESAGGYNALYLRKKITDEGEAKFLEQIAKDYGDYKVLKPSIENLKEVESALNINYEIFADGSGQSNSIIYLNPMLGHGEKENPFKLENRTYPVDFASPTDETYVCKFKIPDGYEMDEAPKNVSVALPNNGGKFLYMVQKNGNEIQVLSKVSISKPIYYAQEYPYLKELYNQIVAKHAESIVLKKTAAIAPSAESK